MDASANFDPFDPPYDVLAPGTTMAPVVFASPHSGNLYPDSFISAARLDALSLRRSEDAFIDELFTSAPTLGMPLIRARFPRAYVDVNREPWELDPGMFTDRLPDYVNHASPRANAGLGTIARVVASGSEIYASKLRFSEAKRRIETIYMPYHARLVGMLRELEKAWPATLLIDCHSMPSTPGPLDRGQSRRRVDFVIGDCHGQSCMRAITDLVERTLRDIGYVVMRNDPYAGGFTTRHYGRPDEGRHALQIEINRALYMDEQLIARKPYFSTLARNLTHLVGAVREFTRAGFTKLA